MDVDRIEFYSDEELRRWLEEWRSIALKRSQLADGVIGAAVFNAPPFSQGDVEREIVRRDMVAGMLEP